MVRLGLARLFCPLGLNEPPFNPTVVRLGPVVRAIMARTVVNFQSHCGAIGTSSSIGGLWV